MKAKTKTNALSGATGYCSWQQVRASDKSDSQGSPDDPKMTAAIEGAPTNMAKSRGAWQQVRATDATESVTS
jgi:hypothetical protein